MDGISRMIEQRKWSMCDVWYLWSNNAELYQTGCANDCKSETPLGPWARYIVTVVEDLFSDCISCLDLINQENSKRVS